MKCRKKRFKVVQQGNARLSNSPSEDCSLDTTHNVPELDHEALRSPLLAHGLPENFEFEFEVEIVREHTEISDINVVCGLKLRDGGIP